MSEVTVTPEIVVATETGAPAAKIAPAPSAHPMDNPAPKPAAEKPEWLDARLAQAKSSVLKELGFESLEAAKAAATAIKAAEEAKRTDAQRAASLENDLKATKAEKEAMAQTLGVYAKSQMGALTEAQRAAVTALAGDDPVKQIQTIDALRSTWAGAVPAPVKDTAPAPSAPKDTGSTSAPTDKMAFYEELAKTNPVVAARYADVHGLFLPK